jgi:hypothetical protein
MGVLETRLTSATSGRVEYRLVIQGAMGEWHGARSVGHRRCAARSGPGSPEDTISATTWSAGPSPSPSTARFRLLPNSQP